jgi:Putative MetA-pathway of phenol degradation
LIVGLLEAVLLASLTAAPAPAPPPPPYSLPWLLRPATPASVLRLDETFAFFEDPSTDQGGATYVTSLIATYRINPRWVPIFRQTFIQNEPPGTSPSASAFSNPLVGINYFDPLGGGWRWTGFFASTIPVGSGGGDTPDTAKAAAQSAAIPARSAMDNALFAVNYWTVIGGLGLARITPGLTLQAEVTVLQLTRARGPDTQDKSRTNFTAGLHAGHFFSPKLSFGAEVRLQRWLTNAAPVRSDPSARQQCTLGLGPRLHFKLGGKRWLRPGLSYTRAFDDPMKRNGYDILQLDVPLAY